MAMASPNFAVVEPSTNGFTAVNERLSPPTTSAARTTETSPLQQKEPWSHANGDSASASENKSLSPQSTLPAKRRFEDVDPGSDDGLDNRGGSSSVSTSPGLNGVRPHTNGNDTDPRLAQSQSGASRDPNWSSQMDDVRMAQLLQAESNARPENGLSQSGGKPDSAMSSTESPVIASDLVTTKAGLQYDQKKRKRAFTNRTKTGCTTCRKRKKKCDEAKPHCNNCLRGGFPCGGYTQRRDMTDASKNAALQAKYPPVPIQSREYWETPSSSRASRSYEPSPLHGLPDVRHNGIMDEGVGSHGPVSSWSNPLNGAPRPLGNDRSLPPPMQGSYAVPRGLSGLSNIYSGTNSGYAPIPLARRAMAETEKHLGPLTNNITESPQNNLEQMITGRYFKPNEPELVELRKRAETACERFNHVSSQGMGQEEMLRCLRNIVEYDPKKPDNSIAPSGSGIRVGTGVKVHSPFWVDYGFNIRFGDNVTIKGGCRIEDCREVQIGNNTVIGPGVTISGELHFHDPGYKIWRRGLTIRIGRNVFIGAGVIIAPTDYPPSARDAGEIVIGDEAYISPGTVVCSNVPQKAIIGAKSLWERLGDPHTTPLHH